jgi:hypothetical protein
MNVRPTLSANPQTPKPIQPKGGSLHRPSVTRLLLRIVDPVSGHPGLNPPLPQGPAFLRRILGFVRMQLLRPLAGSSTPPQNRLNGIDCGFPPLAVLDVGRREGNGQRYPVRVDPQRTLRVRCSPIRRIRPSRFAPPAAGTVAESNATPDPSILSASPRRSSSTWWRRFQTKRRPPPNGVSAWGAEAAAGSPSPVPPRRSPRPCGISSLAPTLHLAETRCC